MNTIFIVTEANATVATGHLMECIVCAKELIESGYKISFWINDDMDKGLKERIPCKFQEYNRSIEYDYEVLLKQIYKLHPTALLLNLRQISEKFLEICQEKISKETTILCIDEFGHRNLQADIIINPMIDSYYWDYGESKAQLFCGAEYLILPKELTQYHEKKKVIHTDIQTVLITMGGVDPQNYTSRLIKEIGNYFHDIVINVVVGGGNQHYDEIAVQVDRFNGTCRNKINIVRNVANPKLLKMMYQADFMVCAGGNTLHEAACIGTPAIMLPSMPHEVRNIELFVNKGFGLMVKNTNDIHGEIGNHFEKIVSAQARNRMSIMGKQISDGMGRKRVVEIIREIGE